MGRRRNGECLICGSTETVKSHLFPRALMLDVRADSKNVIEGSRHWDGVRFRQNGQWDDTILCKTHEDVCGRGDDYVIDLLRSIPERELPPSEGGGVLLPNPHPDLLVHFVYSTVWRFAAARPNTELKRSLGPYFDRIQHIIFEDAPPNLDVVFWKREFQLPGGGTARIAIPPHRQMLADRNVWLFVLSGFSFWVKTDNRPFPPLFAPILANGRTNLIFVHGDSLPIMEVPMLHPVFARMSPKP